MSTTTTTQSTSSSIRSELGWQPQYAEIGAGLDATIDWYRDDWWRRPKKDATEAKYDVLGR
jgi:dTDP-glucose 4,6-dehydratase